MVSVNYTPLKRQGYTASILVGGVLSIQTPAGLQYTTDLERGTCTCPAFTFGKGKQCKHIRQGYELALQCLRGAKERDYMDFSRLCRLTRYAWKQYMDVETGGRSDTLAKRIETMSRYNTLQAAVCTLTGLDDWTARRGLLDDWHTTGQAALTMAFNARQTRRAGEVIA